MKHHIKFGPVAIGVIALSIMSLAHFEVSHAQSTETNPYMGAPVTLVEAPNGAIANKKIL